MTIEVGWEVVFDGSEEHWLDAIDKAAAVGEELSAFTAEQVNSIPMLANTLHKLLCDDDLEVSCFLNRAEEHGPVRYSFALWDGNDHLVYGDDGDDDDYDDIAIAAEKYRASLRKALGK